APLSTSMFTPDVNTDYYVFGVQVAGLGTILTALNLIVTIIRHRAPGMKWDRLPLFTWATLVTNFLILIAFTVLAIGLYLLMFELLIHSKFFSVSNSLPVYFLHFFCIFRHSQVYILAFPAFGIFTDIISTFSKKRIFDYPTLVISI